MNGDRQLTANDVYLQVAGATICSNPCCSLLELHENCRYRATCSTHVGFLDLTDRAMALSGWAMAETRLQKSLEMPRQFIYKEFQEFAILLIFFFSELCWEQAMVSYTKPRQSKKEESERLRGERDQIKFIHLRFEWWQVVWLSELYWVTESGLPLIGSYPIKQKTISISAWSAFESYHCYFWHATRMMLGPSSFHNFIVFVCVHV